MAEEGELHVKNVYVIFENENFSSIDWEFITVKILVVNKALQIGMAV